MGSQCAGMSGLGDTTHTSLPALQVCFPQSTLPLIAPAKASGVRAGSLDVAELCARITDSRRRAMSSGDIDSVSSVVSAEVARGRAPTVSTPRTAAARVSVEVSRQLVAKPHTRGSTSGAEPTHCDAVRQLPMPIDALLRVLFDRRDGDGSVEHRRPLARAETHGTVSSSGRAPSRRADPKRAPGRRVLPRVLVIVARIDS